MDEEIRDRIVRLEEGLKRVEIKLSNGLSDSLLRIETRVEKIEAYTRKVEIENTPGSRMASCPYRKEIEAKDATKQTLYMAIYAIVIAALAGAPAWLNLFTR